MKNIYDTVIIGGGPAAVAAGVYAARKKMKTVFVADTVGGQSVVSAGIENWIGEKSISGADLAKKLEEHLRVFEDEITLKIPSRAERVVKNTNGTFTVAAGEESFDTKTVIVATGGRHRRLDVPGEDTYDGKGVAYCATCDAPFFKDKDVAVIGGGNSALESVVDLLPYAGKIYLLVRGKTLKGDPVTQEQIKNEKKVEIIYHTETREILGEVMVTGLRYEDTKNAEVKELAVGGVFVEIGSVPNSELVGDLVELDAYNQIVIDHKTCATSQPGIFAAGDVTDELYKQNNIAVGDAIIALLSVHEYVKKHDQ